MLSLRTAPFVVALVVAMTALGLVPAQPLSATKHALLVGINEYDPTGLQELQAAEADMAPNLAEDEKAVEFEYVIDGTKQKGTCRVLTVDLGDGVKMELVRIKAGTFQMGSLKNEKERNDNEDRHEVEITKDFYLGKYAVTQAQVRVADRDDHEGGGQYEVQSGCGLEHSPEVRSGMRSGSEFGRDTFHTRARRGRSSRSTIPFPRPQRSRPARPGLASLDRHQHRLWGEQPFVLSVLCPHVVCRADAE